MTTPDLEADYQAVAELLRGGSRFLVTGHRNPDGDSLGSALALALALEAMGKEARVVMRDAWAAAYDGLPGISRVAVTESLPPDWPAGWDALLSMECPEPERPGYPNLLAGRVANLDHHPGNTRYGAWNLVDLPAAAVGEIVMNLLDLLGAPLTEEIATNLWVSLVSDTGSFRYGNTTPRALALGARLVAAGVSPGAVNEFLFESRSLEALRLEALVLATLELHAGGRVATLELPNRFLAESGAGPEESESLVNRARGIAGVQAAALLRESDGAPEVRCSLRSKGTVDVRAVAASYGGGGHRNAAGCRIPVAAPVPAGIDARAKAELVARLSAAVDADSAARAANAERGAA